MYILSTDPVLITDRREFPVTIPSKIFGWISQN
jgi:hypothetical protein